MYLARQKGTREKKCLLKLKDRFCGLPQRSNPLIQKGFTYIQIYTVSLLECLSAGKIESRGGNRGWPGGPTKVLLRLVALRHGSIFLVRDIKTRCRFCGETTSHSCP